MKQVKTKFFLLLLTLPFATFAFGQMLTPSEISQINNKMSAVEIAGFLIEKGFQPGLGFNSTSNEIASNWYFKPFAKHDEDVSSSLIRTVDSLKNTTTTFYLYNPFHYKEFVNSLIKAEYEFNGIQVTDNKSYCVFKEGWNTFVTTEKQDRDGSSYFEISFSMRTSN